MGGIKSEKKILILVSILVVFLAIPPFVNYWVSTPSPIGFIPIEKQEVWIVSMPH